MSDTASKRFDRLLGAMLDPKKEPKDNPPPKGRPKKEKPAK